MAQELYNRRSIVEYTRNLANELARVNPVTTDLTGLRSKLATVNKEVFQIAGNKLLAIQNRGFDGVISVCPFCERMFERQEVISRVTRLNISIPSMYYTQLLGLAIGISPEKLGLQLNLSPIKTILNKITR